jgi:hypothetical protein
MNTTTNQAGRPRSMKARKTTTCQCGRLIQPGHRIVRLNGRWVCIECAIAVAIAKRQAAA